MEKEKLIQLLEDAYRAGEHRGLHKHTFGYNGYDFIDWQFDCDEQIYDLLINDKETLIESEK